MPEDVKDKSGEYDFEVKDVKKQATCCMMVLIVALSVAMVGCVDDEAANQPSATDVDLINDTNVTLNGNATDINVSEVEELIGETEVVPEPEPELKAVPKDQDIIVEMNATVDLPELNVTCTMARNKREVTKATEWHEGYDRRDIKLDVTINAAGEIKTGLNDWQILDDVGREYQTIPHTDVRPMKYTYELSDGDAVRAYLLFNIPGDVIDFTVRYNCSGEIISWTVGNPSTEPFVRPADGFVRYPIRATTGHPHIFVDDNGTTRVVEDMTFQADGDVIFKGTHRRGLGDWVLVESGEQRNVYNVSLKDRFYIVNIDLHKAWSCDWGSFYSSGSGRWEEV